METQESNNARKKRERIARAQEKKQARQDEHQKNLDEARAKQQAALQLLPEDERQRLTELREELKTTRNARKRTRKDQIAGRMSQAAAHFAVDLNFEHMMNHKEVKSIGTQAPSERPLARLRPSPLGSGAHDVWRELRLFLSFPASFSRVGTGFGYRGCS